MYWSHVAHLRVIIRPVLIAFITISICILWIHSNTSADGNLLAATQSVQLCPLISPKLIGWTNLSLETMSAMSKEDEAIVEFRMKEAGVKAGGRYEPSECRSRHQVAIIVPIRNRTEHLTVFLRYMHPFLQRQQLNYVIIVVEQSDGQPRQMAFSINHWNDYNSIPWSFFGAVSAISANDFQLINGYSNAFWGWGGEDDQLFQRTRSQNLTVVRAFDGNVSQVVHYKTMSHPKATPNPDRMSLINEGWTKFKMDGLVDLRYTRLELKLKPLYTRILVDIQPYNITT